MKIKFINLKFNCGKIKSFKPNTFKGELIKNKLTIVHKVIGPKWTETLFINVKESYSEYNEM